MNRDEILAKSRSENEVEDEMEKMVKLKAATISRAVGFLICTLMAILDAAFGDFKIIGPVCWSVYWGMQSTESWILWFQLRRKRGWMLALLYTGFAVFFSILLVMNLLFAK